MKNKIFLVFLVFCAVVALFIYFSSFSSNTSLYTCQDCNIVIISVDSLRPDHLGAYGYDRNVSPNIDNLANQGIVFNNHFAQGFLTPVSEFSMFSSLYPDENGVALANLYNQQYRLKNPPDTITTILKAYNYTTIMVSSSPEFYYVKDFQDGFEIVNTSNDTSRALPNFDPTIWPVLQNHKFFLWLAIGTVHAPYGANVPLEIKNNFVNQNYSGYFKNNSLPTGQTPLSVGEIQMIYNMTYYPYLYFPAQDDYERNYSAASVSLNQDDIKYIVDNYDSGIAYTDNYLGNVLSTLNSLGVLNKTIVILTSAHGEEFGEHGFVMHYDIYDQETHIPLIMKLPGVKHEVINSQTEQIDILPTILNLLKIPSDAMAEGHSLVPLILKPNTELDKYVFIERYPLWEEFILASSVLPPSHADFAVRTNGWELIYRASRDFEINYSWYSNITATNIFVPQYELYNLKNDPKEQHNVYSNNSIIAENLISVLSNWLSKRNVETIIFQRVPTNTTQFYPYP